MDLCIKTDLTFVFTIETCYATFIVVDENVCSPSLLIGYKTKIELYDLNTNKTTPIMILGNQYLYSMDADQHETLLFFYDSPSKTIYRKNYASHHKATAIKRANFGE